MARDRVLIVGGAGVFGRLLAREVLERTRAEVVVAGRDLARARRALGGLGALGARASALRLDLREPGALADAAEEVFAVACAAGPFRDLDRAVVDETLGAGAHWLDLADDADWVLGVLGDEPLRARAHRAGLAVLTGQSSVPAISGALARAAAARLAAPVRARITLYVGNRNSKGPGAIGAALVGGFRDPAPVALPLGRRRGYIASSPDAALLAAIGLEAEFRVVLGWAPAGALVAALGAAVRRAPAAARDRVARALSNAARSVSWFGSDRGFVQAEVWDAAGRRSGVAVAGPQRLAVLPCAIALERLLGGALTPGVHEPASWMPPDEWIAQLGARGMRVFR